MGDLRDTVRLDLADLGLCIRVLLGGRKGGARPDRSATVYTKLAKEAYPDLPVILGGLVSLIVMAV